MKTSTRWAPAPNLQILTVERLEAEWAVSLTADAHAICPACGVQSNSRHSSYHRKLRDLPAQGTPIDVRVRLTRWRCRNQNCDRRIFAERIPGPAAPFARQTTRLAGVVRLFGHSVGGRPSERLMGRLGMRVGHTTILREIKRSARAGAAPAHVKVVGVDDWAWKKGTNYGTVMVDLERRLVVDVLPDRSAASTAAWLREHPTIEIISRDRAGLYAEGAHEGAPQARQVADRFHLLQNFREAVERHLIHPGPPLKRASEVDANGSTGPNAKNGSRTVSDGERHRRSTQRAARAAREARFEEIKVLFEAGKTITAIARELGLGRRRVERWTRFLVLPERNVMAPTASTPARFEAFLARRWAEACRSVRQLFEEIKQQGYAGSYSNLARFLAAWRDPDGSLDVVAEAPFVSSPSKSAASDFNACAKAPAIDPMNGRRISPLTAAALCVKPRGQMTPRQICIVDALTAESMDFAVMRQFAMRFRGLFRGGSLEKLDEWIWDATSCSVYAMRRFSKTLRQDIDAVQNAVVGPWSNGQTERQINRLKTLKRSMYGRASIELLGARMPPLQDSNLHRE
ncbi:transposase [Methylosinus sp. sav-2]|uniref:ISL3 family transposase n=1 Tax=Methylosinus sp. sav-2 TaxID=2485168 RepID=UPI00047EEF7B|nr:ISL3 family transposase [Methylosinus sp. sav-2]TDX60437.1 transposase [Methylosinus sp. sav-2]